MEGGIVGGDRLDGLSICPPKAERCLKHPEALWTAVQRDHDRTVRLVFKPCLLLDHDHVRTAMAYHAQTDATYDIGSLRPMPPGAQDSQVVVAGREVPYQFFPVLAIGGPAPERDRGFPAAPLERIQIGLRDEPKPQGDQLVVDGPLPPQGAVGQVLLR